MPAVWSSGNVTHAVSGATFIAGDDWDGLNELLAVTTLKDSTLRLLGFTPTGELLSHPELLELSNTFGHLRTPFMGPDGALYIPTSNSGYGNSDTRRDSILQITPN